MQHARAAGRPAPLRRVLGVLRKVPGYAAASWLRQMIFDANFRETARLRAAPPTDMFQPTGTTLLDRHPEIFKLARTLVGDGADRSLLSFGCSTAEEVLTLRRYFPEALITGIDISPRRVRRGQRQIGRAGGDARIRLAVAGSADGFAPESFDAIFALSVFRHGDLNHAPPRCDHILSFVDFERLVTGLARCVRPGGLLVLRHANFRFQDVPVAAGFEPILRLAGTQSAPIYDANNQLLPDRDEGVVFRRRA